MFSKKLIILLFLILNISSVYPAIEAEINILKDKPIEGEINPLIFGGFFEFVKGYMNGSFGFCAQELMNRGFDAEPCYESGVACYWRVYNRWSPSAKWQVISDGFNKNGVFAQEISSYIDSGNFGTYQRIMINDTVKHNFYVYYRTKDSCTNLRLAILDTNLSITYFETVLGRPNNNWKKGTIIIPPIHKSQVVLLIYFNGTGSVQLDESSLVPLDSKFGIRKEYYDAFDFWKPTIMRYPGGWYADCIDAHWEFGIGDIDQRTPRGQHKGYGEKLDFGTDEFLAFCKSLNCEPNIVANILHGTPEEAANWVQYCNGPTSTYYGELRAKNGHPEPYKVKYWGIGNEEYDNYPLFAKDFLQFAKRMKLTDNSIITIYDGNLWQGKPFFDTVMNINNSYCNLYSWHHCQGANASKVANDTMTFLSFMGGNLSTESFIVNYENWLIDAGFYPNTLQGITELWSAYDTDWKTAPRLYSMECGLWSALQLHSIMRHPKTFIICERTNNSGMFSCNLNKSGQRSIVASPTLYVLAMERNHSGSIGLQTQVIVDKYSTTLSPEYWQVNDIPWLDVACSQSKDSLFISVINRHPSDSVSSKLNIDLKNLTKRVGKVYQLTSDSYLDSNHANDPFRVFPSEKDWNVTDRYVFPPHSLTILTLPLTDFYTFPPDGTSDKLSVSILPNPVETTCLLTFTEPIIPSGDLEIYDILGKQVKSLPLVPFQSYYMLNMTDLDNGFYYLLIKTYKVRKLIKIFKS